jgi:hypothetical protein
MRVGVVAVDAALVPSFLVIVTVPAPTASLVILHGPLQGLSMDGLLSVWIAVTLGWFSLFVCSRDVCHHDNAVRI